MSEGKSSKGCVVAVVWLVILVIAAVAYRFLVTDPNEEQLQSETGSDSRYTHEVKIQADLFSGYAVLRSEEMKKNLRYDQIRLTMVEDEADYDARLAALEAGEVEMAVFTIDSLLMAGAKLGRFPASIVMVIDETKGADAVLAFDAGVKTVQDLNSPDAGFVLTSSSPSEFLARVVKSHFKLPDLGNWAGVDGQFGDINAEKVSTPYRINGAARNYMLQYGLTRENFYCPKNTAANTDSYWGPDDIGSFASGQTTVIGYSVLGGRTGLMRQNINSTGTWVNAKDTSAQWVKLVPDKVEPLHDNIEHEAAYDEIIVDTVRTYNLSFDSVTGHMTGRNTFTVGSNRYLDRGPGGANVFMIDGSGKWRQRTELGLPTGSYGDSLCQLEYGSSIKHWW